MFKTKIYQFFGNILTYFVRQTAQTASHTPTNVLRQLFKLYLKAKNTNGKKLQGSYKIMLSLLRFKNVVD